MMQVLLETLKDTLAMVPLLFGIYIAQIAINITVNGIERVDCLRITDDTLNIFSAGNRGVH